MPRSWWPRPHTAAHPVSPPTWSGCVLSTKGWGEQNWRCAPTWRVSSLWNACSARCEQHAPPVLAAGWKVSAQDAVTYPPFTTLDGVVDKATCRAIPEFDVPARLLELHAATLRAVWEEGTMPSASPASLHTTGGNSGSPVLMAGAGPSAELRPPRGRAP